VQALLKYVARWGEVGWPLEESTTRSRVSHSRYLHPLPEDRSSHYSSHCRGVEDLTIMKDLGGWKSRAYLGYIHKTEADRARKAAVPAKLDWN